MAMKNKEKTIQYLAELRDNMLSNSVMVDQRSCRQIAMELDGDEFSRVLAIGEIDTVFKNVGSNCSKIPAYIIAGCMDKMIKHASRLGIVDF